MGNKRKLINQDTLHLLCQMASLSLNLDEQEKITEQLNSIASLFQLLDNCCLEMNLLPEEETQFGKDEPVVFQDANLILQNVPRQENHLVQCPIMRYQGKKQ